MGLSISDRSESSNKLAKMISGIKVANLRDVYKNCESGVTLGSRGYFFLMDTDGSRRSRVNEAHSAEEKKISPRRFFLL